jgi:hypothetical protein
MWNLFARFVLFAAVASAAELRLLPEYQRADPWGAIVEADRSVPPFAGKLTTARRGYASVQVVVSTEQPLSYRLVVTSPFPVELYREWFHRTKADGKYVPDALIPIESGAALTIPDPENRVPKQTAQAIWLDFWIAEETQPGAYRATVTLTEGGRSRSVPIAIEVLAGVIPKEDAITLDHNSYGTGWLFGQYPKTLPTENEERLFTLIHAYHRRFYEHRGVYHQLGYGHGGKVGPEFAPELAGSGRNKHITSWDRFDRHYGPLLDGSAFRETRRGPRPIPYVYLPINPDWPASYLWWGEPGYEVEFTNVVSAMERHFREKGWTGTAFELFFNHKKRYKGFSWDGDEQRFARDNDWLVAYRRLFDRAVPADSPVKFLTRVDTSWTMEEQFNRLQGVVNFWVAGEGMLSWYPGAAERLRARGDRVWSYGGTPTVDKPAAMMTLHPLRSWVTGVQGFVRWQTVDPGPDPWFALEGGGETLVYPGDRFGIGEPLGCIRLKVQRNCLQDLALLEERAGRGNRAAVMAAVVQRFNSSRLADWQNVAPPLAKTPVLDWNNLSIGEALEPFEAQFANVRPDAWQRVHEYAVGGGQ